MDLQWRDVEWIVRDIGLCCGCFFSFLLFLIILILLLPAHLEKKNNLGIQGGVTFCSFV